MLLSKWTIKKIMLVLSLGLVIFTANGQSIPRGIQAKEIFQGTKQDDILTFYKNSKKNIYNNNHFTMVEFGKIPSKELIKKLKNQKIEILEYHGGELYTLSIPNNTNLEVLKSLEIKNMTSDYSNLKLSTDIRNNNIPDWATTEKGKVNIVISFYDKVSIEDIENELSKIGVKRIAEDLMGGKQIVGQIALSKVKALAALPIVSFIESHQGADIPLNWENRGTQRVNLLNANIAGGYNLNGEGVVIGVGDAGELGNHLDFDGRVINKADGYYSSFGEHGDHVHGTIGGAGIVDEMHAGMAPKSTLLSQKTSKIITYTRDYVRDHGMVITNNSYGSSSKCGTFGDYNYSSSNIDHMTRELEDVIHVFASGNYGDTNCEGFERTYGNILRAYAASKNALTVGSVSHHRHINSWSGKGPVKDGRLKPEIMGVGDNVISTGRNYNYFWSLGTSMATPSVTGTLALLIQKYRQLNNGSNPKSGLIKAIACNTADDDGNYGPDFGYGFGIINAKRAVDGIINGEYIEDSISENDAPDAHTINVPAGVSELKVMLYWHDVQAESYPTKALINDLNLEVITPNGEIYLPWVLDTTPSNVTAPAVRGEDNLNNIEQVTIKTPVSGNYTIRIKGKVFPTNEKNQDYFISYHFIKPQIELTYPIGGEAILTDAPVSVYWEAAEDSTDPFKLEYSINGGASWRVVRDDIPSDLRIYPFSTLATDISDNVIFRISRRNSSNYDTNDIPTSILPRPAVNLSTQCSSKILVSWDKLDFAKSYEVLIYKNMEWQVIGNTTKNELLVSDNFQVGTDYWFTIRAISERGQKSLRAIAKKITTDATPCTPSLDARLINIEVNTIGREYTSLALSANENISIVIQNNSSENISNIPVYYDIDGAVVSEMYTGSIGVGEQDTYTFTAKADFSIAKEYKLSTWIALEGDTDLSQDTIDVAVKQIANPTVTLPQLFSFSGLKIGNYSEDIVGLEGAQFLDYFNVSNGALSIEEGSVDRSLLIGQTNKSASSVINQLVITSNQSENKLINIGGRVKYRTPSIEEQSSTTINIGSNDLYARGSDTDPWLKVLTFSDSQEWNNLTDINIGAVLDENHQILTSSFQLKIEQSGSTGIEIDEIELFDGGELPVELTYFRAKKTKEDKVLLEWNTKSELNNDYFEVQVAVDGEALQNGQFQTIGIVNGAGTTTESIDYTFVDNNPSQSGTIYYRLKQNDFDGAYEYSPIVSVEFEYQAYVDIFPNPLFGKTLNVNIQSKQEQTAILNIVDLNGSLQQSTTVDVIEGKQLIQVDFEDKLTAGIYVLYIKLGQKTFSHKIIKK